MFEGEDEMANKKGRVKFIWIPRGIAIAFLLFLMLFSLDVFGSEGSIFLQIVGFIIHSLPSLLMLAILVLNWRNPYRCGLLFLVVAALFTLKYRAYQRIDTFILVSFLPVLIGVLFLWAHVLQKKGRNIE